VKKFWIATFNIIIGLFVIAGAFGTVAQVAGWGELPFPFEWYIGVLGLLICIVGIASFWIPEKSAELVNS